MVSANGEECFPVVDFVLFREKVDDGDRHRVSRFSKQVACKEDGVVAGVICHLVQKLAEQFVVSVWLYALRSWHSLQRLIHPVHIPKNHNSAMPTTWMTIRNATEKYAPQHILKFTLLSERTRVNGCTLSKSGKSSFINNGQDEKHIESLTRLWFLAHIRRVYVVEQPEDQKQDNEDGQRGVGKQCAESRSFPDTLRRSPGRHG